MFESPDRLLVHGAWLLLDAGAGASAILDEAGILVADGFVAAIDHWPTLKTAFPDTPTLGSERYAVIPGLVNSHDHGRGISTLQQGIADRELESWLVRFQSLLPVDPYWDTLYSAAMQLRAGITTTTHSHSSYASVGAYRSGLEQILDAYRDSSIRVVVFPGYKDQNRFVYGSDQAFVDSLPLDLRKLVHVWLESSPGISVREYLETIGMLREKVDAESRLKIGLGPVGPQWCTDKALTTIAREANETGLLIQMHLLETQRQTSFARHYYSVSAVEHLERLGLISPRFSGAHGVWITEDEATRISAKRGSIIHCPSSNLRLGSGVAPITELKAHGVNVGLGMDSTGLTDQPDMLLEMKIAKQVALLSSDSHEGLSSMDVLAMATIGGARALGWDNEIGSLQVGKRADFCLIDLSELMSPYCHSSVDKMDLIVNRATRSNIYAVIIGGNVVYLDGQFPHLDIRMIESGMRASIDEKIPAEKSLQSTLRMQEQITNFYQNWPIN